MAMSASAQMILDVERDLQDLRREYVLFLNGASKVEPFEQREELARKVKRLRNINHNRTEDQFRANNTISKAQSHFQLWDRQVEKKYSGDYFPKRKKAAQIEEPKEEAAKKPAAAAAKAPRKSVVISDPTKQRDEVVKLYDEYMRMNLSVGSKKMINFTKFQSFIKTQTEKVREAKKVDNVGYEVMVQNEKVVIKARSIKK